MKYAFLPLAVALALSACQPPEADNLLHQQVVLLIVLRAQHLLPMVHFL